MKGLEISVDDRNRVAAAVRAAEAETNGEIVTILSPRSDAYHDVGLHYAVAAMLVLLTLVAAFPLRFAELTTDMLGGWDHAISLSLQLTLLLGAQILVFLIVRYALAWMPLRMMLTPGATKARRVRRQAIVLFRACAENRTADRTGILLYLSVAERRAEIVADAAISARVAPERWGDAMAALIARLHAGDTAQGMIEAVGMIGAILAEQLPEKARNPNELPDGLIEL